MTVPAGYYEDEETKSVSSGTEGTPTATKGAVSNHSISVTPSVTNTAGYIAGSTKTGTAVTVSASELVSGTKSITQNGTGIDVTDYASVNVSVNAPTPVLQTKTKTYTPTTSQQTDTVTYDTGYDGLSEVDITINAVATGTAGTPTASKGTVNNHSISVTPSVTNTTGYITGGTKTGTAVTVSASELVSGTKSITTNGTGIDVTNYAAVNVSVDAPTPTLQTKTATYTPTESEQIATITPDTGYDGLDEVDITVEAISSTYVGSGITRRDETDLTASGATVTVPAGYYAEQETKSVSTTTHPDPTVSVNTTTGLITASHTQTAGYVSAGTTTGTSQLSTQAGTTITPTESEQTAVAANKYTLGAVKVGAISSTYIGSGITQRSSTDLTASGATVTVPAGYYSEQATKSVDSMTLPTSASASATSGYTSKATIDRSASDQYINIPTGYNAAGAYYKVSAVANGSATGPSSLSGSSASISTGTNTITLTKTGVTTTPTVSAGYVSSATASTATVALTASVTVDPTPTASGATVTVPAGYYTTQTTKSVSSGSATGPSSITESSATVTTGTNTLTLTKTGVSTTPTVSAGYVSSATASTATVALTASVTTKAAATITPGTTNQTIAAGTYLTGAQTISGDANLVAGNIKSGTSIFGVNGSYAGIDTSDATATAADIVNGKTAYADGRKLEGSLIIQTYYTGSTAPSSSLGNNGDIYFQS